MAKPVQIHETQFFYDVDRRRFGFKYIVRDYGDYRTVAKAVFTDGAWDLASKVDEYVYWRSPLAPQS